MKQVLAFPAFMQMYGTCINNTMSCREKGEIFAKLLRLNNTRLSHMISGSKHDPYYGYIDEDFIIRNWED